MTAARKDSLLEDTMHLKDLDGVSEHFDNNKLGDNNENLFNMRAAIDPDAMNIQVKDRTSSHDLTQY